MIDTTGKVREIDLGIHGGKVNIGSYELYGQLYTDDHKLRNDEAEAVDDGIYFYVAPEQLDFPEDKLVSIILAECGISP